MKKYIITKGKILSVLLRVLIIYCIYSILRSIGILYIALTDDYFYHLDFKIQSFREKNHIFIYAYYYFPYFIGIFASFFMKKLFNSTWISFLLMVFFGLILFRLIDSNYIRPMFGIFRNAKINVIANLLVSVILFVILQIIYKWQYSKVNNKHIS